MSAGAVGDVLGYPDLPDEFHHASHRSTLLHNRSSVRSCCLARVRLRELSECRSMFRSVLYHSRLSTISQAGGVMRSLVSFLPFSEYEIQCQGGGLGAGRAAPAKPSGSTLPFPHNLRAQALRHLHSF